MSTELLISNIGYALTTVVFLSLGLFVLAKGPRRRTNALFFLITVFITIFMVSHAFGINAVDPLTARTFFLFNACNIFMAIFCAHWVLAIIGKERQRRAVLIAIYAVGIALFLFYMLFPDTFMAMPAPALYFPNYYVVGPLYSIMVGYFVAIVLYFMWEVSWAYHRGDYSQKNKLKYVVLGLAMGFCSGLILELPIYHIYVDPILSAFIWLSAIPLAYTMIANSLMDMKVVARRATVYVLALILITILVVIVNSLSVTLARDNPEFPVLAIPIASSLVILIIGRLIWDKIKETEVLKYEFITIITHKFRTPLTSIRWSAENIAGSQDLGEIAKYAGYIGKANAQLVELTNILLESSTAEGDGVQYHMAPVALEAILRDTVATAASAAEEKHTSVRQDIPAGLPSVMADEERLRFVMQVLIDNAISYTPDGKNVTASLASEGDWVTCSVKDDGIGVAKADLPRIFTKFYRSARASSADTEGVGLGLFMAKTIIEKQGGKIWAVSEGEDKGTTVGFKLKAEKEISKQ